MTFLCVTFQSYLIRFLNLIIFFITRNLFVNGDLNVIYIRKRERIAQRGKEYDEEMCCVHGWRKRKEAVGEKVSQIRLS